MNENTVQENPVSNQAPLINDFAGHQEKDTGMSRWLTGWAILLSTVLLFASAVNCLFRWLAYGFAHDAAALAVSLIAGLVVYFLAGNSKHIASPRSRLLLAISAVLSWAILMPLAMRIAGFN